MHIQIKLKINFFNTNVIYLLLYKTGGNCTSYKFKNI